MGSKRGLGLAVGYGLLVGALILALHGVWVLGQAVFSPTVPVTAYVGALLIHGGAVLTLVLAGKAVVYRMKQPHSPGGVDLGWARTLFR